MFIALVRRLLASWDLKKLPGIPLVVSLATFQTLNLSATLVQNLKSDQGT